MKRSSFPTTIVPLRRMIRNVHTTCGHAERGKKLLQTGFTILRSHFGQGRFCEIRDQFRNISTVAAAKGNGKILEPAMADEESSCGFVLRQNVCIMDTILCF